jgi:hypothetical protein
MSITLGAKPTVPTLLSLIRALRAVINRILTPIYLVCFSPKTATQLTDSFVVASLPLASLAFTSLLGQINCTD